MRKILFNCSLILLTFIVADHLLVMLSFITSTKILPFVLPFSFLIAILLLIFIERNTSKPDKLWSIVLSLFLIGLSIALSIFYFDFSWDGQWYHQSAIYHIEGGWNPFTEPIRVFEKNNDSSIIYFPKGAWYYAASVYSTIGIFEAGKSINFILLFVALFLVYFTLREYGIKKKKSIVATLIVILNPVVWSEITTYLNDGLLVLYLTIYIAMIFAWFKNPNFKIIFPS